MLSPVITSTLEILLLVFELDEFKGLWRMIHTLLLEKLTSLRRVASIEVGVWQSLTLAS
ncbi:MAG: hypothetical protein JWL90_3762 [Chthoniobacteraceae bacterium]|nr:hypothetical protein [Chthoniobacteraceae bacterium]